MDKHEEQIRRAEEAHAILHSPMFVRAFDDTRAAILNAIASLDNLRDDKARDLHSMVKGLEKVRRVLEADRLEDLGVVQAGGRNLLDDHLLRDVQRDERNHRRRQSHRRTDG